MEKPFRTIQSICESNHDSEAELEQIQAIIDQYWRKKRETNKSDETISISARMWMQTWIMLIVLIGMVLILIKLMIGI